MVQPKTGEDLTNLIINVLNNPDFEHQELHDRNFMEKTFLDIEGNIVWEEIHNGIHHLFIVMNEGDETILPIGYAFSREGDYLNVQVGRIVFDVLNESLDVIVPEDKDDKLYFSNEVVEKYFNQLISSLF